MTVFVDKRVLKVHKMDLKDDKPPPYESLNTPLVNPHNGKHFHNKTQIIKVHFIIFYSQDIQSKLFRLKPALFLVMVQWTATTNKLKVIKTTMATSTVHTTNLKATSRLSTISSSQWWSATFNTHKL